MPVITFDEIHQRVAAFHAAEARPFRPTPRDLARVAAIRLARTVAALDDPKDRIEALALATSEAARLIFENAPQTA